MATYGADPLDNYFYSYNPYIGRYPRAKDAWKYKSYISQYGDAEAFNNQQRAQLKSILSQINPKLTPRVRKANTKDVAVQVNPKRTASVQCSIGPRTLLSLKRDLRRRKNSPDCASPSSSLGSPKFSGNVRYPRTIAVYSPIAYRSITSFLVDENTEAKGETQTHEPSEDTDEDNSEETEENTKCQEPRKQAKVKQTKSEEVQTTPDGLKGKARVRFQFLEQKYGYYHCRDCNLRWESAYVWCVQGTNKVYFKQYCRKCQKEFNPYRVEDITCHTCKKARCICAITPRHVDPKRPHRQDLCGRCKGKRLSCDSTFSFKYII
ncbi:zygote arrest protein 1 [Periophthalmus magnuspinnatus]|uniref:3CxxC-type domain-containing protein n=1 Tax=Periophthalmus magnuspinnatus TaxID=409849 RepID=A0A3B4B000_9GOBI|nr:zygote arrest protein 1 [Periophthalmus magnuspinnatus]